MKRQFTKNTKMKNMKKFTISSNKNNIMLYVNYVSVRLGKKEMQILTRKYHFWQILEN